MNRRYQLGLLKKYEPVMKFNKGEKFFPVDVTEYVENSSLWAEKDNGTPRCIVPEGQLNLANLGKPYPSGAEETYYLKFTEPLTLTSLAEYRIRREFDRSEREEAFHSERGRLARVGYLSRILDAIFSLTLLTRGRVPGDAAAAASLFYKDLHENGLTYHYHGRVVENGPWTVLQYWFFYPFNDWRTSFYGVNDHEADWESIFIYLYKNDEDELMPEWTAYSAHGYTGDDQRRRWDDPELKKIGDHPVIYVGAGSHASYFSSGDYQIQIILSFLTPITRLFDQGLHLIRKALRIVNADVHPPDQLPILRIPFIDYARGDGITIGKEQKFSWAEPILMDPVPPWINQYKGLWGLYTKDPIAGEDAPAGPMFNRDGSIRLKWHDPVSWAGLEKVTPPNQVAKQIKLRLDRLEKEICTAQETSENLNKSLRTTQLELTALSSSGTAKRLREDTEDSILIMEQELADNQRRLADCHSLNEALIANLAEVEQGKKPSPRAHLHHPHNPEKSDGPRSSRLGELWAAGSIGLALIAFVIVLNLAPRNLPQITLIAAGIIIFIEAAFRGYLNRLISIITGLLAFIAAGILIYQFFWQALQISIVLSGVYLLWENLREFLRR